MSSLDWISFWDSKHSIYVDARHRVAHYRRIADDIRRYIPAGAVALDYGCGEALSAHQVADATTRLILCEPAAQVRALLTERFSSNPKIVVRQPKDISILPAQSLDFIAMHSVAQYLSAQEFDTLIKLFQRLLKPGGLFVLGDVIPRRISAFSDALALLRFGAQERFFWAALRGLLRTYFSDYWRLRQSLGLMRYDEADISARLEAAGFSVQRAQSNIGHNVRRMTFLAHAR